ncbi:MAG: hypothetical protein ACKO7P_15465 [Bacteroidota bacterium]
MKLQKLIIPKEKRVLVYSILNKEIINDNQKKEYPESFIVDIAKLQETSKSLFYEKMFDVLTFNELFTTDEFYRCEIGLYELFLSE